MGYHVAIDIGASSGRLILGSIRKNILKLSEIYRFHNNFQEENGLKCWNIEYLFEKILVGLKKINNLGINDITIGIDTWGVDYVLLDSNSRPLGNPVSYRDIRTEEPFGELLKKMTREKIYAKTGIQFQHFNTIYQLFSENDKKIKRTHKIGLIADYLGFKLTGKLVAEISNASTTQLLNLKTENFDSELLTSIGIRRCQFPELVEPGTSLGPIKESLRKKYNLPRATVISVATHDTASAIAGIPATNKDWAYLSSGTWSLIGTEETFPNTTQVAFDGNYTNERGVNNTFRFLKNIMGMWIVQRIRQDRFSDKTFQEMADAAKKVKPFQQFIDVNDSRFLDPVDMVKALQDYCYETQQVVPKTLGEIMMCVYSNLALYYANEITRLRKITRRSLSRLYVVGGGSKIALLNQLTADAARVNLIAGPSEATAIGNIIVQMISTGEVKDIREGRNLIKKSFSLYNFNPVNNIDNQVIEYSKFLLSHRG